MDFINNVNMQDCVGIIDLNEDESKMNKLIEDRPLASVPIVARYRIIDFALSNMTNSDIANIGIFSKNKCRSLIDHLSNGKPWDLHRWKKGGLRVFNFSEFSPNEDDIHNLFDNMEFLNYSDKKYVLIASSYMICNIDYSEVIEYHEKSKNDVTIIYKNVKNDASRFYDCNILNMDKDNNVISVGKNIGEINTKNNNVSMEMYVMKTELLRKILNDSVRNGLYKRVKEAIKYNLKNLIVKGYEFKGYLACINSLKNYYDFNMDCLNRDVYLELFNMQRPILTKSKDEPPTFYKPGNKVNNSILANGCIIEGSVENSIIGRKVIIEKDAIVKNSIVMQSCIIKQGAILENIIVDKGIIVNKNRKYVSTAICPSVLEV